MVVISNSETVEAWLPIILWNHEMDYYNKLLLS